jgi:putative oxidoreductase
MLNLFPELLNYQQLAPVFLRLILAAIFWGSGYAKLFKARKKTSDFFNSIGIKPGGFWAIIVGLAETASGIMFLLGFLTQLAAILISILMIVAIITVKRKHGFGGGYDFELLILACALALLFMGAGIFSFDLPLL